MPRVTPQPRQEIPPAPSLWRAACAHLESVRTRVLEELRAYPPPITACDAQFNYLLEQRDAASEELARLEAISGSDLTAAECARAVREAIIGSRVIDAAEQARLLTKFPA